MTFDAVASIGAGLASMTLAFRIRDQDRRGWAWLADAAAVAAAAAACAAGEVAVLVPAWLGASVLVSGHERPNTLRAAVGVLGDAVAAAALVSAVIDTGEGAFPWTSNGAVAEWGPVLLGVGVAARAGVTGMREPGLLIVASVVALRGLPPGPVGDASVLVALGPVAALVAWAEGPLAALPILGVSLFGVGDPVAGEAGTLVLAGAAVAIAGVTVAGAPAVGSRWRFQATEGPPGGVTAAGLALLALVPAVTGLVQVPLARAPEAAVALASTLAVVGAAASAAGARRLRSQAFSARFVGTVAAVAVLAAALVAPVDYAEVLDIGGAHGSVVAGALSKMRGGLLGAGALAAVLTGVLVLVSRPPSPPRRQRGSSAS